MYIFFFILHKRVSYCCIIILNCIICVSLNLYAISHFLYVSIVIIMTNMYVVFYMALLTYNLFYYRLTISVYVCVFLCCLRSLFINIIPLIPKKKDLYMFNRSYMCYNVYEYTTYICVFCFMCLFTYIVCLLFVSMWLSYRSWCPLFLSFTIYVYLCWV